MGGTSEDLKPLAEDTLSCIEQTANFARAKLVEPTRATIGAFAGINTLNDIPKIDTLAQITSEETRSLQRLEEEPVIARIGVKDEGGRELTYFVTRAAVPQIPGRKIASYKSPVGRIAAQDVGATFVHPASGEELEIIDKALIFPRRAAGEWDSRDTQIYRVDAAHTVPSLRQLLVEAQLEEEDLLEWLLSEGAADRVRQGVTRGIIARISLRDQPVLDKYQDEIFRLPLDTELFLVGPPGTGKTTTLIKRLSQKIAKEGLEPTELRLIEGASGNNSIPHRRSWLMFTPTALLKQYLKEAFAREQVPASENEVQTWDDYRRKLARNTFGILRSQQGRSGFSLREEFDYLSLEAFDQQALWTSEFRDFVHRQLLNGWLRSGDRLATSANAESRELSKRLLSVLQGAPEIGRDLVKAIELVRQDIDSQVDRVNAEIERIVRKTLNSLLMGNRGFLEELATAIAAMDVEDEDGIEEDDLSEDATDEPEMQVNLRRVSMREAMRLFEVALRGLARARASGRRVSPNSRNGRIIEWLGDRIPPPETLRDLGQLYDQRAALVHFRNPRIAIVQPSRLSSLYRRFRVENAEVGRWYEGRPKANEISTHEVDLLLLTLFRNAREVFGWFPAESAGQGILGTIGGEYRNQILVDEAVDFSPMQLAVMREISAPQIGSFFICGDLNQRITEWGIRDQRDLSWVSPDLRSYKVAVAYRQSRRLVELAKDIAVAGGGDPGDVTLPDRVDSEGLHPVLLEEAADLSTVVEWLAQRIAELERQVEALPPIAVLVNDEVDVIPVAHALSARLASHNLRAVPCSHGQLNGTGNDVRVFDLQHIKGLEFEAVFFIAADDLVRQRPQLFAKFLYVGATRAATYLGISCRGSLPAQLAGLRPHFRGSFDEQAASIA
jgi:hypothetical protein